MNNKNKRKSQFVKELKFIVYYINLRGKTFSNAHRSALRAGYSESYARTINSHLNWQEMEDVILELENDLTRIFKNKL